MIYRWRACLDGILLGAEAYLSVPVRCRKVDVSKPSSNDIGLDSGFKEVDGGSMATMYEGIYGALPVMDFSW